MDSNKFLRSPPPPYREATNCERSPLLPNSSRPPSYTSERSPLLPGHSRPSLYADDQPSRAFSSQRPETERLPPSRARELFPRVKRPYSDCCRVLSIYGVIVQLLCTIFFVFVIPYLTRPTISHQVVIIGAGPVGISVAYHLSKFAGPSRKHDVQITLYEKEYAIGGQYGPSIFPYGDTSLEVVDLGLSGYPASAKVLHDIAAELHLDTKVVACQNIHWDGNSFGVFDGSKFILTDAKPSNIFGNFWTAGNKFVWLKFQWFLYHSSPQNLLNLIDNTMVKIRRSQTATSAPFESLHQLIFRANIDDQSTSYGPSLFRMKNINDRFQHDFINPWARGINHRELKEASTLATIIAAERGNVERVFNGVSGLLHRMAESSNALVVLNSTVFGVEMTANKTWVVGSHPSSRSNNDPFDLAELQLADAVVLTAPPTHGDFYTFLNSSSSNEHFPDISPFHDIQTTLFISTARLSPRYFRQGRLPDLILFDPQVSSNPAMRSDLFYSINLLKMFTKHDPTTGRVQTEFLYKIVSESSVDLSDEVLIEMLGYIGVITWSYRKVYRSYLQNTEAVEQSYSQPFEMRPNLWYTHDIKNLGNSLEMSVLMGRNIASLMWNEFTSSNQK